MERLTDKNKQGFEIYDEEKLEFEDYYDKLKEYEDIDDDPKHLEKVNKAFKIITKKNVHKSYFIDCLLYSENDEQALSDYNRHFGYDDDGDYTNPLTKEEFDLLKEML